MGQILIRQLDDEIIDIVKKRAAANKRSMEAEVRAILEEAIVRPGTRSQPGRKLTDFLEGPPSGRTQAEIDTYVRSLRDEWDNPEPARPT